jgi:sterol desaturase/sphingolipid hydroxylase (fatty acid hydroxylase superfamily)
MENVEAFFQHIDSGQRTLLLVGGIVFFWMLETVIPLFDFAHHKFKHAGLNLFFTFTTLLVNMLFAYFIILAIRYAPLHQIGLLNYFHLTGWLYLVVGLMVLDLIGAWFIHWVMHQTKWMWKFHLIHHSDTWVDTTTANRHHPGESVFRAAFTLLAVVISGSSIWLLYLYQSLSVLMAQFNHANIRVPVWLDLALRWVLVTPDMHKVHHHYVRPYTDSNYGNIFSLWDRLFGTYAVMPKHVSLRFGIDSLPNPEDHDRLGKLMNIPFEPYHPASGAKFEQP